MKIMVDLGGDGLQPSLWLPVTARLTGPDGISQSGVVDACHRSRRGPGS
jgi:hypothetical protein